MYTISYPLGLAEDRGINHIDNAVDVEGKPWRFFYLPKIGDRQRLDCGLSISGFPGATEARAYLPRVRELLDWMMVACHLPIVHPDHAIDLPLSNGTNAVNMSHTAIHPDSVAPSYLGGWMTATSLIHGSDALSLLARNANSVVPSNDPKLTLALELFRTYDRDPSGRSRFLMMVIILETLAKPTARPPAIATLLDGWMDQLGALAKQARAADPRDPMIDQYTKLKGELGQKRESSITDQIVCVVLDALKPGPDQEPELRKKVKAMYNARSKLQHEGHADGVTGEHFIFALETVPKVLKFRLTQAPQSP